jgi:hypothetical protein
MIPSLRQSSTPSKYAALFLIGMWITCTTVSSKACSTVCTTVVNRDTVSLDSVKKLVPRGFYILDEAGARLTIKTKIDLDAVAAKWKIADDELTKRNGDLLVMTLDRNRYRDQNVADAETIRLLKRALFWAHFWKYSAMAGTAILGAKLILKP